MNVHRLSAVVVLGLAAAACAGIEGPTPEAPSTTPAAAAVPVAGYDWFYQAEDGEARLAYGPETSEDLGLGLSCAPGSGRLLLTANAGSGEREIHLESGGETGRFAATAEPSGLNEDDFLTAEAPSAAPVFRQFRRVGWLARWRDGRREAYAPQPGSVANIERFFTACG